MDNQSIKFAFFGTDEIAVFVLDELAKAGFLPALVVSTPDTKQGRGMQLIPPPVKVWAEENNISVVQPEKLDAQFALELDSRLRGNDNKAWDLFIVTSYGKIVPEKVFSIPKHDTLNVHPSLLPLYRGPSPIESAILNDDKNTGVTVMKIDVGVDSGPIVSQEFITFKEWELKPKVAETLARAGGKLLAETIPLWINNQIEEQLQDDALATHTKKMSKKDGQLDLEKDSDRTNFLKIMAYHPWPGTFFFDKNGKRVKITDAAFIPDNNRHPGFEPGSRGKLEILRVIPEGKKEQNYKPA